MTQDRPLIGITSNDHIRADRAALFQLKVAYATALSMAGGLPVLLPYATPDTVAHYLARLDGLILSGGGDVPASAQGLPPHSACHYLSVARWESERLWYQSARTAHTPVLGICLGMQVMCVCSGGRLLQDITQHRRASAEPSTPNPDVIHPVRIEPDSWLAGVAPDRDLSVVSCHHQAAENVPPGLRAAAVAQDGILEAVEVDSSDFAVGVQWHPERSADQPDWLLQAFVKHCIEARKGD